MSATIKFTSQGGIIGNNGSSNTGVIIDGFSKVYNAVWNDLVDCLTVPSDTELEPGYCYCFDGKSYFRSRKYMDDGIMGIHSDTYGFAMGDSADINIKKMKLAVAGVVLAYVDGEYPPGTILTCTEGGRLTRMKREDASMYPERLVATFWKPEYGEEWGEEGGKIKVNGRSWVRIR